MYGRIKFTHSDGCHGEGDDTVDVAPEEDAGEGEERRKKLDYMNAPVQSHDVFFFFLSFRCDVGQLWSFEELLSL